MNISDHKPQQTLFDRIRHQFIGMPRNINEPSLFHKISLIPSWHGSVLVLTACHRLLTGRRKPSEHLVPHTYLAIFIAIATALQVSIIAYAYSRIIEHFPNGGTGRRILHELCANAGVAASERVPLCQDTGMVLAFVEVGQDLHITGGAWLTPSTGGWPVVTGTAICRASVVVILCAG